MKIAISQRVESAVAYDERRDALAQDWAVFFSGLMPEAALLPMPNRTTDTKSWLSKIAPDALLLSGGNDWGDAPERDTAERAAVEWAMGNGRPILGICRGLHAINTILGGTVAPLDADERARHVATRHQITFTDDRFTSHLGKLGLMVNSFHSQAVFAPNLAPDLRAFATDETGMIEGVYSESAPILAIQWHPERPGSDTVADRKIVRSILLGELFWL
jgi:gamma-glutamyl-gamma-aminobutyrate hydrolase PuuD